MKIPRCVLCTVKLGIELKNEVLLIAWPHNTDNSPAKDNSQNHHGGEITPQTSILRTDSHHSTATITHKVTALLAATASAIASTYFRSTIKEPPSLCRLCLRAASLDSAYQIYRTVFFF